MLEMAAIIWLRLFDCYVILFSSFFSAYNADIDLLCVDAVSLYSIKSYFIRQTLKHTLLWFPCLV